MAQVMHLLTHIVFGTAGNSAPHQVSGFAPPEPGFTWTLGAGAALELTVPPADGDILLEIACNPFTYLGVLPAQRLDVRVNGVALEDAAIRGEGTLGYMLPRHGVPADRRLRISLGTPDAASPAQLGAGTDGRPLGFMLREIRLHAVAPFVQASATALPPMALPGGDDAIDAALLAATGLDRRGLALRFESLGHNCEFGLVQRHLGAEPLSLLRFAGVGLDVLLAGLPAAFAGIGADPDVRLFTAAGGRQEFLVQDAGYRISMHTHRTPEEATAQQVRAEQIRHLAFLQRQFRTWLRTGARIFVYQRLGQITLSQARPLLARLRAFGPNALLYVDQSRHMPSGAVEQLGHGLFHGVLDHLAPAEDVGLSDVPGWISLMANTHRLWARAGGADG